MADNNNNLFAVFLILTVVLVTLLILFKGSQKPENINYNDMKTELESTEWLLKQYKSTDTSEMVEVPSQVEPIIKLENGEVTGYSGCNNYMGSYTIDGENITFSTLASTQRYCMEPANKVETEYFNDLLKVKKYMIDGGALVFMDENREELLNYSEYQEVSLENVMWSATAVNNGKGGVVSLPENVTITAEFKDGTVSGKSGCNSYNGGYKVDGDKIEIGTLATTRMACEPEVMEIESQYLQALEQSNFYKISQNVLNLRKDQSTMVNFQVK